MLARLFSCALIGLNGELVTGEVDVSRRQPGFTIVGLPDTAVQEARERVRSAIRYAGFSFPLACIVVNLAPADPRKEGPAYDLPIALGVLIASEQLPLNTMEDAMVVGELGLDGTVRHVPGMLVMAALARELRSRCPGGRPGAGSRDLPSDHIAGSHRPSPRPKADPSPTADAVGPLGRGTAGGGPRGHQRPGARQTGS